MSAAPVARGDQEEKEIIDLVGVEEEDEFMDEFALLQEEDIIYAAAKHEQDIAESPSAVTVITREQIENTHCTHLACVLRNVPEVQVRQLHPMFTAVGARALVGETGDKVLVLIDGREVNNEIFGGVYWQGLSVHMNDIERIEIIRGPGSALYGANAHSMVVSISTRTTCEDAAEFFAGSGEHDRSLVHLRLEKVLGEWSFQASGGYETSGHWRIPDRRQQDLGRIRLRIDRATESSTSSLQLGLTVPEGQVYTSLAPTHSYNSYLAHLLVSHRTKFIRAQLSANVYTADFHLDMPLYYGDVKLGEFPEVLDMFSSSVDADVQATWEPFGGNLLIGGGNYRWMTLVAENNQPDVVHQHRVGVFLHDEQRLGKRLILTGGVRLDYNSITPLTASPRFACVWRFAQEQFLRFSFGRAFRKPSFMNTSAHFKGVQGEPGFPGLEDFFLRSVGNDGLGNESITSFEVGYRGRFLEGDLTVEAGAFFNLYRDTISFFTRIETGELSLPDLSRSKMEYRNEGREVNSVGGSVSAVYRIRKVLWLSANYTFRHTWFISEPEESGVVGGGKGDRLPWEPAHLANLSFHYLAESGLRLGLAAHGASANDLALPVNGGLFDDMIMVHHPPFAILSGFVSWRIPIGAQWVELGARAFNTFHQGFRDTQAVARSDGVELGGELLGRRIFFFVRGAI